MSPASNSKSKDKKAARVSPSASVGTPASGYDPLLGTFHTLESMPVSSPSIHVNGRFRNIDDTDDHTGNSSGVGTEYDSVSNNGSWSGESDDHKENKEKASVPSRQESVPGADIDKREKVRLKNERKHQLRKERRAQELHERCSGYLISRKLEALAQQLVAMGIPQEQATMALIMTEGRVEESVAWLFERSDEEKRMEHNPYSGGNLKIDISDELAKITDLEIRYKVSKQDVERAVVASEGDIEKAEEMLKVSKQEHTSALPKSEETGYPPTVLESKLMTSSQTSARAQSKVPPAATVQQKRDEKDFNYTKAAVTMGSSVSVDPGSKVGMQVLRKPPLKVDWTKSQPNTMSNSTDRSTWPNAGSSSSISYSSPSSFQVPTLPSKFEAHHLAIGDDLKHLQLGSMRDPVAVMQRPQSLKQVPSLSGGASAPGWHPSSIDLTKPSGLVSPFVVSSIRPTGGNSHSSYYNQHHFQPQQQFSNSSPVDSQASSRSNGLWSWESASPTLSAASSLGLFVGANGASGSSSSTADWNTGSHVFESDYTNIDWSLDLSLLTSRSNGLWTGVNYSSQTSHRAGQPFGYGLGMKPAMRPVPTLPVLVLPDGGVASSDPIPVEQRASPFQLF